MTKRRGKNRPPKLGPSQSTAPPPLIVTLCRTCPALVPKEELTAGMCETCRIIEDQAERQFTLPRSEVARRQFDTGAASRGRQHRERS